MFYLNHPYTPKKNTSHLPGPTMEFPMFPNPPGGTVEPQGLWLSSPTASPHRTDPTPKNPRDSPRLDFPCLHTLNLLKTNVWNDGINSWGLHYWQCTGRLKWCWIHVKHRQLKNHNTFWYTMIYQAIALVFSKRVQQCQLTVEQWSFNPPCDTQKTTGWLMRILKNGPL